MLVFDKIIASLVQSATELPPLPHLIAFETHAKTTVMTGFVTNLIVFQHDKAS